jgi:hypothetical protein
MPRLLAGALSRRRVMLQLHRRDAASSCGHTVTTRRRLAGASSRRRVVLQAHCRDAASCCDHAVMTKTWCQDGPSVLSFRGLLDTPDSLNNSIKIIYITILPRVQVKNEMFVCSNTARDDNGYRVNMVRADGRSI